MNNIILKGVRLYANHGVLEQERKTGAYFTIDLKLATDFTKAMQSDELSGTVSYADVFELVKREMNIPSKLLEHVGGRIANAILNEFPSVSKVDLRLMKQNPPMGAELEGAGIEISINRQDN